MEGDRSDEAKLRSLQRLAQMGKLGAGITHEARNILTGVVGFAQVGQKRAADPGTLEILKLIEKESRRCLEVLQGFLAYARQNDRVSARIDVNELVDEAARMLRHQLNLRRVRIALDLAEDAGAIIGDVSELKQVLLNLALNGAQAMPEGGELRMSTRCEDGNAIIRVSDSGPGVPEEIRDLIFEPFFTTKPPEQGTGLGLALATGIVQTHEGSLILEPATGKGATFTIRLKQVQ